MPDWKPALSARLSALRLTPAREREIVDELSQHLDDLYREKFVAGATHEEAMRSTLDELDEGDLLSREMRPLRQASAPVAPSPPGAPGRRWLADVSSDIRYALRTLQAAKAWTLVVLLLLAFGIGTNAVIFSVTHALLVAPLPGIAAPDALVRLAWTGSNDAVTRYESYGNESRTGAAEGGTRTSFSYAAFTEFSRDARGTADLFASLATCALFATAPAFRATKVDLNAALKDTSRAIAGRGGRLARALLVVQVTLSLVLLVGAGLFLRTVVNLHRVDVGFDPDNLLLIRIMPAVSGYDQARTTALYTELLHALSALPGVRGAALSQPGLLAGGTSSTDIFVNGRTYGVSGAPQPVTEIHRLIVSPDFFRVIGMPIVLGRALTDQDDRDAPRVAVINEAAARAFFPGVANPVGQRFGGSPTSTDQTEIVGVVRDTRYSSLGRPPPPIVFVTYLQVARSAVFLELRTSVPPETVTRAARNAIRSVAPTLPLAAVSTETEEIASHFSQERTFAQVYTAFGSIALLLASIGLFGLMSYNVAQRTAEMGIRMALGAQRSDVLRLVMRESLALVLVGLASGCAIALATGHYVASLLFGVPSRDPVTFTAAAVVMTVVCAVAAYLPARRASRVDPMTALHCE
ncbi:MAG TPA: FtsX-like permease family protein [Vicinamibacterales bacterium]|nr:FtsX-like permease family protein [Vicinamibacterales bacterium]